MKRERSAGSKTPGKKGKNAIYQLRCRAGQQREKEEAGKEREVKEKKAG